MSGSAPGHTGAGGRTSRRILAAAETLFAEHGFGGVSMSAIAIRAGVSKASVFHHFSTKNSLYLAVLLRARQDTAIHLQNLESGEGSFATRLSGFAGNHLARLTKHKQMSRLILRELLRIGPRRARQLAEHVFEENFRHFVTILRSGQESGELRADLDPAAVATILLGTNVFFFEAQALLRHFRDVSFAENPESFTEMLVDILLHGIRPRLSAPGDTAHGPAPAGGQPVAPARRPRARQ